MRPYRPTGWLAMYGKFKRGDRVRVSSVCHGLHGYLPGDKGTVLHVSALITTGSTYYTVARTRTDPEPRGLSSPKTKSSRTCDRGSVQWSRPCGRGRKFLAVPFCYYQMCSVMGDGAGLRKASRSDVAPGRSTGLALAPCRQIIGICSVGSCGKVWAGA